MTTPPLPFYREIQLTQGQVAKVSPHRFEELNQYRWFAWWCESVHGFYARRNSRVSDGLPRHAILMHRYILGLEHNDPREGDHANHNTLDNTDGNLSIVDQQGQAINHGRRRDNTCGYRGLHC